MDAQDTIFIDNDFVPARTGARIEVINPATEEIAGSVPDCGPDDIDAAVASSKAAFAGEWRGWSLDERVEALSRFSQEPRARRVPRRAPASTGQCPARLFLPAEDFHSGAASVLFTN